MLKLEELAKEIKNKDFDPPAELIGKYKGRELLLCGSGRSIWDDLEQVNYRNFDVMAVNDMYAYLPFRVDHFWSNDTRSNDRKLYRAWIEGRRPRYFRNCDNNNKPLTHSNHKGLFVQYAWPWDGSGTSGLMATYCGLCMGYDRIVLAGVPMDNSGHFFDPPPEWRHRWDRPNYQGLDKYWKKANDKFFEGKVKSCSGNTMKLLGGPNE